MIYEEKFVAFLDILGFKHIIDFTENNFEEQEKMAKVLNHIATIRDENYHGILSQYGIIKHVSVFSDSIVISYSSNLRIGGGLFHILMDIVHISLELLSQNIYVRGGVTCGPMYHDEKISFGPAMINAYRIEEEKAVYPRIVIDNNAIKRGLEMPGYNNSVEMEAEYLETILCKDEDGIYYLDFLSQWQEYDDSSYHSELLISTKNNLLHHLTQQYSERIMEKYKWFAQYYNRTIQKLFEKPTDNMFIKIIS